MSDTQPIGRAPPVSKEIDRLDLAKRLKEAREYLELSQDEVASVLNVPRSAISLMEAGRKSISVRSVTSPARTRSQPHFPTPYSTWRAPPPSSQIGIAKSCSGLRNFSNCEDVREPPARNSRRRHGSGAPARSSGRAPRR